MEYGKTGLVLRLVDCFAGRFGGGAVELFHLVWGMILFKKIDYLFPKWSVAFRGSYTKMLKIVDASGYLTGASSASSRKSIPIYACYFSPSLPFTYGMRH